MGAPASGAARRAPARARGGGRRAPARARGGPPPRSGGSRARRRRPRRPGRGAAGPSGSRPWLHEVAPRRPGRDRHFEPVHRRARVTVGGGAGRRGYPRRSASGPNFQRRARRGPGNMSGWPTPSPVSPPPATCWSTSPASSTPTPRSGPIRRIRSSGWPSAPRATAARRCAAASTRRTSWRSRRPPCEYRAAQGITGPLFLGKDTHAPLRPGPGHRARGAGRRTASR